MDDAALVGGIERLSNLAHHRQGLCCRDSAARQPIRKRISLDEFQHETLHAHAVARQGVFESVNRTDMGMVQRGEDACLALESVTPSGSHANWLGKILIATSRSSFGSRGRKPLPSRRRPAASEPCNARSRTSQGGPHGHSAEISGTIPVDVPPETIRANVKTPSPTNERWCLKSLND